MALKYFIVIYSLFCFWCCSSESTLTPVEYIKWVEKTENGLWIKSETGTFQYRLQYKPTEYLAIRELKKIKLNKSELQEKVAALQDMQYFTFQLGLKDGTDILKSKLENSNDYTKNVEYLSFEMQRNLKLVEGMDTLPCIIHHFERTFGIGPYATIVLAFPQSKDSIADKTFVYDDQYFGNGIITMNIKRADINSIPKIKMN